MEIKTNALHPDALMPLRTTAGAACFDLHALIEPDTSLIQPRRRYLNVGGKLTLRTGLAFEIPSGHCMLIFNAINGVRLSDAVGVVSADDKGEVTISLRNDGSEAVPINHGDRIAQAMILPVPAAVFVRAEELSETARGTAGFGSTGVAA